MTVNEGRATTTALPYRPAATVTPRDEFARIEHIS